MNKKQHDGWMIPIAMIIKIQKLLKPGSTILEFGTGNGTTELLKNFNIISVEHDENWTVVKSGKYKHAVIYAPLEKHSIVGWYDKMWYSERILDKNLEWYNYDAIIIDGPNGVNGRAGIVDYFPKLRQDVPIFMDDIHVQKYMKIFNRIAGKRKKEIVKVNWYDSVRKFGIIY